MKNLKELSTKLYFSSFKPVDMNEIECSFVKYEVGNKYDRHVETIKKHVFRK